MKVKPHAHRASLGIIRIVDGGPIDDELTLVVPTFTREIYIGDHEAKGDLGGQVTSLSDCPSEEGVADTLVVEVDIDADHDKPHGAKVREVRTPEAVALTAAETNDIHRQRHVADDPISPMLGVEEEVGRIGIQFGAAPPLVGSDEGVDLVSYRVPMVTATIEPRKSCGHFIVIPGLWYEAEILKSHAF
ncbi:MAG: hypothetical protein WD689_12010 [Gaiellaceae bacterium]